MKIFLLKHLLRVSKFTLYGLIIQCLAGELLFAVDGNAQTESIYKIHVTLSDNRIQLEDFIREVESQTEFHFTFDDANVKLRSKINLEQRKGILADILEEVSEKNKLKFQRINENIHISQRTSNLIQPVKELQISEQSRTITGKVVSDDTPEGLPGVNVILKGTSTGTVTDINGEYSIDVPSNESVLVFSSVGFVKEEIVVGNRSVIDMNLVADIKALEEIVVVGYGTQKKSDLTGSVVSVKSEDIEQQGPKVNVLETIVGLTPGLNLSLNSNTAEQEDVGIQIRGQNSITASNKPLIVLDGVPYAGSLNQLNQNDIESIDVLKDASSTAIYGARGANGVIIITTKQGSEGAPTISYNGSYGIKEIYNVPDLMNGEEHWNFAVERFGEDVIASYPTRLENYQEGNSTDWVDLATRAGKQMRHNIKLDGGSENMKYFVSGTYSDVEGVAKGDNFKQYAMRVNLSYNITEWLTFGTNSQYAYQDLSGVSANFNQAFFLIPLIDAYEEDGSLALYPWPEEPLFANPLSNLNIQDEHYKKNLFSNNYIEVDIPFVEGLSYRLNTGLTFIDTDIGRFWGPNTIVGFENDGQALTENTSEQDILIENLLKYERSWGKHNINLTALYSSQQFEREGRSLTSRQFPTNVLTWYQHDVAGVVEPSSTFFEQKYISQMGRVNYNYDSRYLLTLTLRRDGYSGFGEENKFGTFPSMAIGWNIGDEAFMAGMDWLDQLKIRGSFGRNGNQAINPYQTLASLNQLNYLTGENATNTAPGYYPGSLSSPGLGWETSNSLNLGVDFSVVSGRVFGSVDYYNTSTYDLLLDRAISPVHGITNITQNIGETMNKGVELSINSVNVDKNDFTWSSNLNFAHNKNEIVDLYGNGEDDIANGWFIGEPISANFGYVYDGVWQMGDDIASSPQPDAQPGDVKVQNTNNDDQIGPEDRAFIGQQNPKFTAGLTNTFKYKNFTFSFIFYTQQGMTRVNPLYDTDITWQDARRNTINLNYWSEENPTNDYPENREGTNPFQVRFYQDASFVRLRDVNLSYNFGDALVEGIGMSQMQVYFNVRNALTFTSWEGLDPELGNQRSIPLDRTFLLGLNFAF